jgi:eukaryotic-like serine/threonine-protein kinase
VSPLDELNEALSHFECASLRGQLSASGAAPIVSGTIPDADSKAWLSAIAERYFPNSHPQINVDIVPPPLCRSLAELSAIRRDGLLTEENLSLHLINVAPQLREGDTIKVEVHAPAYPVSVRIDYFSLDGQVQHLWPNDREREPSLAADALRVFGQEPNGKVWKAGGAPFGTEMISVIAIPSALGLGGPRPTVEQSVDYLRDIRRALDKNGSSAKPNLFQTLLVTTRGR